MKIRQARHVLLFKAVVASKKEKVPTGWIADYPKHKSQFLSGRSSARNPSLYQLLLLYATAYSLTQLCWFSCFYGCVSKYICEVIQLWYLKIDRPQLTHPPAQRKKSFHREGLGTATLNSCSHGWICPVRSYQLPRQVWIGSDRKGSCPKPDLL